MSAYVLTIGGVDRTVDIRASSIRVEDILNESPNLCYFTCNSTIATPPLVGQDVLLGIGDVTLPNLLFGGTITTVEQAYDQLRRNVMWNVTVQDYTYLLNRRRPIKVYTAISATTVVIDLISTYAPSFTTTFVNQGLPVVTVTFDGTQDLLGCLSQVANLAGAYVYPDYARGIHFFVLEPAITGAFDTSVFESTVFEVTDGSIVDPDPLDENSANSPFGVRNLIAGKDLSQVRDRVFVKGAGTSVVAPTGQQIAIGSDIIPVSDSTVFQSAPGTVQAITDDSQIISYTGTFTTYHGATTGTDTVGGTVIAAPSAGPVATQGSGAGNLLGTYTWKLAFSNGSGETLPSSAGNGLVTVGFGVPGSTFVVAGQSTGSRMKPGTYQYATTFVTAQGETTLGPATPIGIGAFPVPFTPSVSITGSGKVLPGTYTYAVTFITQDGETVIGPTASITINAFNRPTPQFNGNAAGGGVSGTNVSYKCTVVTAEGETPVGNGVTITSNQFSSGPTQSPSVAQFLVGSGLTPNTSYIYANSWFHSIYGETPLTSAFNFTTPNTGSNFVASVNITAKPAWAQGVRLYRANNTLGTPFQLVAEITNGATLVSDRTSDSGLSQNAPKDSKVAGVIVTILVPASGEPGVLARRLYRTVANGTDYFMVAEIQNDIATNVFDLASDDTIKSSKRPPVSDPCGRQVNVTNISTLSGGVVTGRGIYRSKAGGGTTFLIGSIRDVSTTTFVDNMPDSNLNITAPGASTAGANFQVSISVPTGNTGIIARNVYRTLSGGSLFQFLFQVAGNNSFVYVDNIADGSLGGAAPPLINGAGSGSANLISIQTGPAGITQRVLYRNKASDPNTWFYVGTINDNSTTSFVDNQSDSSLGRPPLAVASLTLGSILNNFQVAGAKPGDTTLEITNSADALNLPTRGWIKVGAQQIFFGTRSGTTLSNIPATGFGSITAQIAANTAGQPIDLLTGVSGIVRALKQSANLNIWTQRDDVPAQGVIAALEGGDGIHEFTVVDTSLLSQDAINKRGDAELAQFKSPMFSLTYTCRDIKTKSGRNIVISLGAPTNLSFVLQIQQVTITGFEQPNTNPVFNVKAATTKFGIQDLIRRAVLGQGTATDHP